MKKLVTSLLVVVLVAVGASLLSAQLSTDGVSRYPELVVKDAMGTVVGQIVGVDNYLPVVLLTEGSNHLLARVSPSSMGGKHRVYYANNDCTGQAYLETFTTGFTSNDSFDQFQGVLYGIGKPFAGSVGVLYSTEGGSTVTPSTESEWISLNPAASRCFVTSRSGIERVMATTVVDLDTLFDTPFDVE